MTTEQTRFPTGRQGEFDLNDWAIGVVDDAADAERCMQALEAAGVAPHNILLVPGKEALEQVRQERIRLRSESILVRLMAAVDESREGEEEIRQAYLQEAGHGHLFLGVHVPDADQMDRLSNLRDEHKVHTLAYFRPAIVLRYG